MFNTSPPLHYCSTFGDTVKAKPPPAVAGFCSGSEDPGMLITMGNGFLPDCDDANQNNVLLPTPRNMEHQPCL